MAVGFLPRHILVHGNAPYVDTTLHSCSLDLVNLGRDSGRASTAHPTKPGDTFCCRGLRSCLPMQRLKNTHRSSCRTQGIILERGVTDLPCPGYRASQALVLVFMELQQVAWKSLLWGVLDDSHPCHVSRGSKIMNAKQQLPTSFLRCNVDSSPCTLVPFLVDGWNLTR